tara:strand:+ start:574 stop:1071 length:498 start_codon:yes stop_codon:yes gene_type:complete
VAVMKTRKNARAPSDSFTCTMCNVNKVYTEFGPKKNGWPDLEGNTHKWHCKACDCKYNAELHMKNPHARLFLLAKRRAEQKNMEFTLTKEIVKAKFPKDNMCPVLKEPFQFGIENKHYNPTIDRIDNTKGYTPENIMIVSYRVNSIKRDCTDFSIFRKIADFYDK